MRTLYSSLTFLFLMALTGCGDSLEGKYQLVTVRNIKVVDKGQPNSSKNLLNYPKIQDIEIKQEKGKYYFITKSPLLTVANGESSIQSKLYQEIVFTQNKKKYQVEFLIVGEDSFYTYKLNGQLNENATDFSSKGSYSGSVNGIFVIQKK